MQHEAALSIFLPVGNQANAKQKPKSMQTIEKSWAIKGGDTIAASLGAAFGNGGQARAVVSGELSAVAESLVAPTARLSVETLCGVLIRSGCVRAAALERALDDCATDVENVEASALVSMVKARMAAKLPPIVRKAHWRLSGGLLVPCF